MTNTNNLRNYTEDQLQAGVKALEFCRSQGILLSDETIAGIVYDYMTAAIAQPVQPAPAVILPLTEFQRKNITAMWNRQNRNYTVADIIDAVEAAHGIGSYSLRTALLIWPRVLATACKGL